MSIDLIDNPNANSAEDAGLRYVGDDRPGYSRRRAGKGFCYYDANGARIADPRILKRIRSLVIPPAWTEVWICPHPRGHIQVTARDARGRKQYRYHPEWQQARGQEKFTRTLAFARALPGLRKAVTRDIAGKPLTRRTVLATVVRLLETTLIRVGTRAYAEQNKSYGLTTMRNRHVEVNGATLQFDFVGKSGKRHCVQLSDRRAARILKQLQELPGQELFQYLDEAGERRTVESADVNAYLREISGDDFTARICAPGRARYWPPGHSASSRRSTARPPRGATSRRQSSASPASWATRRRSAAPPISIRKF